MERTSESDETGPSAGPTAIASTSPRRPSLAPARTSGRAATLILASILLAVAPLRADTLAKVRASGVLSYGSDKEGGGPYAFPDPDSPRDVTGFEVEIMGELARGLGARAVFKQGPWDRLLQGLSAGRVDVVTNGYEWTEAHARDYLATRPYYVYRLQLMARRDGPIGSWDDLKRPNPRGKPWTVGVLVSSASDTFAVEEGGPHVKVVRFDGATDAMTAVANGQCDATLQDLPAALFYRDRFPALAMAGPPVGRGYYVMYLRKGDETLRDALDRGIGRLIESGDLRRIDGKYGLWDDAQEELAAWDARKLQPGTAPASRGWRLLWRYRTSLLDAATVTIVLSLASMPLAMILGLFVALGRMYGPGPVRAVLSGYVELLRGTPLMLQLYVLFYLLRLPPWVAGIAGLAINYSAYEAEIYRAGLQAIPAGQMEAALALGMSRAMALRRVIVPQAVRIVIPPVTNDFIALFKDTSVCSVITLVELTKQYSILANSTGGVFEFAMAAAVLYMAMSVPLSWFSRWSERRLEAVGAKGGALA